CGALVGAPMSHYRAADNPAKEWPYFDGVSSVAVSPDGKRAVTGGIDGRVCLWSLPDGRPLASAPPSRQSAFAVAFTPDGATVLSGGGEWQIHRWDVRSLTPIGAPIRVENSLLLGLAVTPDGRQALASVLQKNAVLRVDLTTGAVSAPLKHLGPVRSA